MRIMLLQYCRRFRHLDPHQLYREFLTKQNNKLAKQPENNNYCTIIQFFYSSLFKLTKKCFSFFNFLNLFKTTDFIPLDPAPCAVTDHSQLSLTTTDCRSLEAATFYTLHPSIQHCQINRPIKKRKAAEHHNQISTPIAPQPRQCHPPSEGADHPPLPHRQVQLPSHKQHALSQRPNQTVSKLILRQLSKNADARRTHHVRLQKKNWTKKSPRSTGPRDN
jgi:hypothetical protein